MTSSAQEQLGGVALAPRGFVDLRSLETVSRREANSQGPTPDKNLQGLRGPKSELGVGEAIIPAAFAGIMHHDDAQKLLAGAGDSARHRYFRS